MAEPITGFTPFLVEDTLQWNKDTVEWSKESRPYGYQTFYWKDFHGNIQSTTAAPSVFEYAVSNVSDNWNMSGNITVARQLNQKNQMVFLSLLFISIVTTNSIVIFTIGLSKKKSRMNFFIRHLAIADLSVGFLSVFPDLIWKSTIVWLAGNVMCKLIRYLQAVAIYASTYVLVALSLDRLDAIARPLNFSRSGRRSRLLIAGAWLTSAILSLPMLYLNKTMPTRGQNPASQCYMHLSQIWHWQLYVSLIASAVFLIPALIIIVCYVSLIRIIWRAAKNSPQQRSVSDRHASQRSRSSIVDSPARRLSRVFSKVSRQTYATNSPAHRAAIEDDHAPPKSIAADTTLLPLAPEVQNAPDKSRLKDRLHSFHRIRNNSEPPLGTRNEKMVFVGCCGKSCICGSHSRRKQDGKLRPLSESNVGGLNEATPKRTGRMSITMLERVTEEVKEEQKVATEDQKGRDSQVVLTSVQEGPVDEQHDFREAETRAATDVNNTCNGDYATITAEISKIADSCNCDREIREGSEANDDFNCDHGTRTRSVSESASRVRTSLRQGTGQSSKPRLDTRLSRNQGSITSSSGNTGLIPKAKIKTVKVSFIIVMAFILCWLPYFLFNTLDVYGLIPAGKNRYTVVVFIQSLAPLNSVANPLIYGLFYSSLAICRRAICNLCARIGRYLKCCCRCEGSTPSLEGSFSARGNLYTLDSFRGATEPSSPGVKLINRGLPVTISPVK